MEHKEPDERIVPYCNLTEKPDTSIETVKKAMQGDKEAFSALFMQTYRPMYLVVKSYLRRDEDIYDALQNGYTKAYKYLSRLQTPEAFFTWLKKTMENAAKDIRSDITGRESFHEDMQEFADELTAEYAEDSDRRADIQEVLSQLEPNQAEVLTLHYYDGMKVSEIAQLLDEPRSTIYSRLATAKKALIERLKVKGIDKSLYSGSVSAMIAVSLRSLIGTDVLSAATAQQMLDDILGGRQGRLGAAAYKLLEARRNRAILRAVSLLMGLTVLVSCVTVALLNGIPWKWLPSLPARLPGIPSVSSPLGSFTWDTTTDAQGGTNASGSETQFEQTVSDTSATSVVETVPTASASPDSTGSQSTTATTVPPAVFIPDYRPGKANTEMRNPTWRAVLQGADPECLDWQDEWVYCFDGGGSYKFRRDGTGGKILIQTQGDSMTAPVVWGDWIYYISGWKMLKRIRTDSAVVETIVDVSSSSNGLATKEINGFVIQDQQLVYQVWQRDSFGGTSWQHYSYSPTTNESKVLPLKYSYGFLSGIPVGDWFLDTEAFCADSVEGTHVDLLQQIPNYDANEWQSLKSDLGYLPAFLLGDKAYMITGYCIDFSGEAPKTYHAIFRNEPWIEERPKFRVEFADESRGRLAVTLYDDTGVYPQSMRWYSEKDGWGEDLPAVLMRNSKYQTYQVSGDGAVFSTKADGTWYSCQLDGSDYREYIF